MKPRRKKKRGPPPNPRGCYWYFTLYIAGQTSRSTDALDNLKKICDAYLPGKYCLKVVDLLKKPQLARSHQILALPTLVRQLPLPIKKMIGNLSNTEQVLIGLNLRTT
jgi:circadian clock protein KaiB